MPNVRVEDQLGAAWAEVYKQTAEIARLRAALDAALGSLSAVDIDGERRADQIRKEYAVGQSTQRRDK